MWFPEIQFQLINGILWYAHSCEHIISSKCKFSVYNWCWFRLWYKLFTEDSRATVSFAGLSHELIFVQTVADMVPGTLSHLLVLWVWETLQGRWGTFSPEVVSRGTCCGRNGQLRQGSGETGVQPTPASSRSWGHKKPCILHRCSYWDVCSGNQKESK